MLNEQGDIVEAASSSFDVGSRILKLRKQFGFSQRGLAQQAGVTNGSISMIEQNRVSPSVASLKKILHVFGMSLGEFFAGEFLDTPKVFYRAHEMKRIAEDRVVLMQVGDGIRNRLLQVLHEIYSPGGDTGSEMLTHTGEESGVIVRGEIEVTVGEQCEVLVVGDSYYFSSRIPHRFRNQSKEVCEIVSVCTPPTF
jgi:transcriptional regulator with XRE-family HTH domain